MIYSQAQHRSSACRHSRVPQCRHGSHIQRIDCISSSAQTIRSRYMPYMPRQPLATFSHSHRTLCHRTTDGAARHGTAPPLTCIAHGRMSWDCRAEGLLRDTWHLRRASSTSSLQRLLRSSQQHQTRLCHRLGRRYCRALQRAALCRVVRRRLCRQRCRR